MTKLLLLLILTVGVIALLLSLTHPSWLSWASGYVEGIRTRCGQAL